MEVWLNVAAPRFPLWFSPAEEANGTIELNTQGSELIKSMIISLEGMYLSSTKEATCPAGC